MTGVWVVLWRDVGLPVWPNLLASALWTWPLLWWHHSRLRAHVTAEVERINAGMIEPVFETEEGL